MAGTLSGIKDYLGRLIKQKQLTEEQAAPTPSGPRALHSETVIAGLTPSKLGAIFKSSAEGNNTEMLALAAEMEEREPHYASVLQTRKLAVLALDAVVIAASDDAKDVEIADAIRALMTTPAMDGLKLDMLDGLGKGYSVVETIWQPGKKWMPIAFTWRDPLHFQFGPDGRELRLRKEGSKDGEELYPGKFVCHVPKLKSGLPSRAGLGRLAAWSFMIKSFGLKDWAEFCEAYGKPLRIGTFDANATPKQKAALLRALRSIGRDFAAIVPEGMNIRFETSAARAGGGLFHELLKYIDEQLSKAILGQTMTTDNGSSKAQAEVHNEVRKDIVKADAKQLAATLNRDLVRIFVDVNFGPQEHYPVVTFPVPDEEDTTALVGNVAALMPFGFEVEASVMGDRLGLPDPADGYSQPVLRQPPATAPGKAENTRRPCPSCGKAHNRIGDLDAEDDIDAIAAIALDGWEEQLDPLLAPIRKAANSVSTYDEFEALLPDIIGEQDVSAFAIAMTKAMFKAYGLGGVSDDPDAQA
ncbi:MAG: DUF935 domain-containing protein [Roseitalea sp.]|nr:DUF935 domain-containing protein [Roseitalea sp.]MBO6950993.1 DUF935 domain-containing protein [Rhizobiaceae bacterium]MBO6591020.1 DUF935 domain-containing protein [Roseitalea sp.]MBO6599722.1 DUF935 domain-containing protein [Roseitalea sp.]MBO6611478.1 DUF935 domain-containing protein [Roseitalea sp.]